MSHPFYSSNEPVSVGGYSHPVGRWRQIALEAQSALQADPNDTEAREALAYAQHAVGSYAQTLQGRERGAVVQDTRQATDPGAVQAFGLGFGQGASFGLADEVAGAVTALPRLVPGGESPGTAYYRGRDEHRAQQAAGQAFQPVASFAGDVTGAMAGGTLATRGLIRAAPVVGSTVAAGAQAGASLAQKLKAALTGGAIGAGVAGANAYGRGEEGPVADLGEVPPAAAGGFALGTIATGFGNRMARRSQVEAAKETEAVNSGIASNLQVQQAQAQVAANEARAGLLETRHQEAVLTAPARVQSARNAAALSTERLQAQPTIRARQTAAADRAQGAAERAGAREADRLQDLPLNRQMQQDRATILAFRASRLGKMSGPGAGSSEQRLRQWALAQGMDEQGIERALSAHRRMQMPGSGVNRQPEAVATPEQPVVPTPTTGTSVPTSGTVSQAPATMPGSPREAARTAYVQAEAAGQNATAAARRAAGMAQEALPAPTTIGLDDVQNALGESAIPIQRLAMSEPNEQSIAAMIDAVSPLSQTQRDFVTRMLPVRWREVLGI